MIFIGVYLTRLALRFINRYSFQTKSTVPAWWYLYPSGVLPSLLLGNVRRAVYKILVWTQLYYPDKLYFYIDLLFKVKNVISSSEYIVSNVINGELEGMGKEADFDL